MSLTNTEVNLVQNVWKQLMIDSEESGVLIFKTFLNKYDYYSMFERFRDHPKETIDENKVFRGHCVKLMKNLDEAITNLKNEQQFNAVLNALGSSHAKRRVQPEQFDHLGEVVLDILKSVIKISNEEYEAWTKVLKIAFTIIAQSLNK